MAAHAGPKIENDGLVFHIDPANFKSFDGGSTCVDLTGTASSGAITGNITLSSDNGGTFVYNSGQTNFIRFDITSTPIRTSSPLSLTAWIKYTSAGMLFSSGGYYGIWATGSNWYWNGAPNWISYTDAISPPTNAWFHLAFTFDGSTNPICYLNGVGATSTGTFTAPAPFVSNNITIGEYDVYQPYSQFGGSLGPISFYSKVLTQEEIDQSFNAYRGRFGV